MVIDLNASLGHWPFGPLAGNTPAGLLRLMDRVGIRQACVAPLEGLFYFDLQAANRQMHRAVRRHRKRLWPFAVLSPAFPGWREDLAECDEDLRTVGVRLFPGYHGYALGDACCEEFFAELERRHLPVQIAPVVSDPRMHHPRAMVPPADLGALPGLLRRFPNLAVCVLNAAGLAGIASSPRAIPKAARLVLDIAWVEGVGGVAQLARTLGAERVAFGTNMPLLNPLSAVYKLREAPLERKAMALITRANALRFLGCPGRRGIL